MQHFFSAIREYDFALCSNRFHFTCSPFHPYLSKVDQRRSFKKRFCKSGGSSSSINLTKYWKKVTIAKITFKRFKSLASSMFFSILYGAKIINYSRKRVCFKEKDTNKCIFNELFSFYRLFL